MTLVNFKRLSCDTCHKIRWHEGVFGIAKCVTCETTRPDATHEPIEIERFVG